MLAEALALVVVWFVMPVSWIVAFVLVRRARREDLPVLWERALSGMERAVILTAFGIVFYNNDLAVPFLDVEQTRLITRGVLAATGVTALFTLWLYRK